MKRQRREMYRAERLDVHFNVKVSRETRAALRAGAVQEGLRDSDFGRTVIAGGIAVWRMRRESMSAGSAKNLRRLSYDTGVLFDLEMSPEMRTALSTGAAAEGVRISEFAPWVIKLGLAAWGAGRESMSAGSAKKSHRLPHGTGVLFDLQMSPQMRAALSVGAGAEGMSVSEFARWVIERGLKAWQRRRESLSAGSAKNSHRLPYGTGVLFDLQMSPQMRAALSVGAGAEGMSVSEFVRWVMDLGLEACRAERAPKTRCSGGG